MGVLKLGIPGDTGGMGEEGGADRDCEKNTRNNFYVYLSIYTGMHLHTEYSVVVIPSAILTNPLELLN